MNTDGTGNTPIPNLFTRWDQQNHHLDQYANLKPKPGQPAIAAASASLPVLAPVVTSEPVAARGMTGSVPLPQYFGGNPAQCKEFINQVKGYLEMLPQAFPTDSDK
ncbi:Hypothetical predicted protein, partial [Pelobates cultripes]